MGRRQTVSLRTWPSVHTNDVLTPFDRELQDNFTVEWNPQVIANAIKPYIFEHHITTVRVSRHIIAANLR